MEDKALNPRIAAKTVAACVALLAASVLLFGFPGICGMVGGILPASFLPSGLAEDLGFYGVMTGLAGTLLSALWLLLCGIAWLYQQSPRKSESQPRRAGSL